MIDDATGLVTGATFREQEDAAGYLEVLAMTVEPKNERARANLGALFRSRLRISGANPIVQEGDRALVEGRNRRAARFYRKAAKLDPDAVEPRLALARVQLLAGRLDAARRSLEALLERHPDNDEARELAEALVSVAGASATR